MRPVNALSRFRLTIKPAGFVERQLRGWTERWERSKTTEVPEIDAVLTWLRERLPPNADPPSVVHGDFKLDNVLLDPLDPSRIVAVFDWEMSALGDPLVDLGILLAYWQPTSPPEQRDALTTFTDREGYLSCAEIVERSSKEIAEVGLDVRVRGPESVSIHAVPKLLQRGSPERLLRDLLSEVSRGGGRGFSDAVDLALATMACHGSIRAGDALSPSEVKALLGALDHADFAGHCPHGRPIVSVLSWAELERKVGRR